MKRRNFIQYAGLGAGALMMPTLLMGSNISAEALLNPGLDVAAKKVLADVALNAARSMGASYADARIGRYLNQYVFLWLNLVCDMRKVCLDLNQHI